MLEPCSKRDTCIGYPYCCEACWTAADIYNHYPLYDNAPKPPNVAYLCDRLACPDCSYPECKHTTDISHAVNFTVMRSDGENSNKYMEMERETVEPDMRDIVQKRVCFPDYYDDYDDYDRTTSGLIEEY